MIQNIVAEEIQNKGIEGVTVRLIAKRAGITPTTIYYYYRNKEELFDKIKFNVTRQLDDFIFAGLNQTDAPEQQLRDLIEAFIKWSLANPRLLDLVFDTLPPKINLTQAEMTELYQINFKITKLLESIEKPKNALTTDVKVNATVFIGLTYGVVKLFLNKRVFPEHWEDITPLKDRMIEIILDNLF